MYHPLLLPPDVVREFPALLDDRNLRVEQAAAACYRSEAFAEDLHEAQAGHRPPPPHSSGSKAKIALLWAAPVCAAVFGGALSLMDLAR